MRPAAHWRLPLISLLLTLYGLVYIGLALWSPEDARSSSLMLRRLERLAMLGLPLLCWLLAWRQSKTGAWPAYLRFYKPLNPVGPELPANLQLVLNHTPLTLQAGVAGQIGGWLQTLTIFLPALPMLLYVWLQSNFGYTSHFLVDTDFTNISSALNHTARGDGLLRNAFLQSGSSGSYLGHHFAPALLLFVPFYKLAHIFPEALASLQPWSVERPTHFLYAILLALSLLAALLVWARTLQRSLPDPLLALLVFAALLYQPGLWRLAMSFHFEILVLLAAGLLMLSWQAGSRIGFYASLLFWLLIKEDMAIYLACFSLFLIASPGLSLHRHQGWWMLLLCLLYAAAARAGLHYFADQSPIAWQSYWSAEQAARYQSIGESSWQTAWQYILLAGGLVWLAFFQLRYALLVLLPLALMHMLSYQPWHNSLLGHYSYPILPFIFMGWLLGVRSLLVWQDRLHRQLVWPVLGLALAMLFYQAVADSLSPVPGLQSKQRAAHALLEDRFQELPPGSCLQTIPAWSAHTPLNVRVLPLQIPEQNYYRDYDWQRQVDRLTKSGSAEQGQITPIRQLLDPRQVCPQYFLARTADPAGQVQIETLY